MLELRQLQYFVALGEELHFGRASERLRISKPTLSQQLRVLERHLGVVLLERRHHLRLTQAGQVLLNEARELLGHYERLRAAVSAAALHPTPLEVRITNGLEIVLHDRLERLAQDGAPAVNLVVTNGVDAEHAVLAGLADAALVWAPTGSGEGLLSEGVGQAEVCLVMPNDHPLAHHEEVPVSALQQERVVLFPRASGPRVHDAYMAHLFPREPQPRQIITPRGPVVGMEDMLREATERRAVVPFVRAVATALCPPQMVLRPIDPPLQLPIHLVCRDCSQAEIGSLLELLRLDAQSDPAR